MHMYFVHVQCSKHELALHEELLIKTLPLTQCTSSLDITRDIPGGLAETDQCGECSESDDGTVGT